MPPGRSPGIRQGYALRGGFPYWMALRTGTASGRPVGAPPDASKAGAPGRAGCGESPASARMGCNTMPTVTETPADLRQRIGRIMKHLRETYPDARCALDHLNPYQLLVATILSAQCTDKRVNMVTPALFARYPDARALAAADPVELEGLIQSTGFYRNKAKNLLGMAAAVVARHGGEIPADMEALTRLPGVGRKTANVVLGSAFGLNEGVVVDTHVARISALLGLTREKDPVRIERDLVQVVDRPDWTDFSHLVIHLGREFCVARRPQCATCPLRDECPGRRPASRGTEGED